MQIVFLDGYTMNSGDMNWGSLEALGDLKVYDRTKESEIIDRAKEADIILVNKTLLSAKTIAALPNLKYIGVTATGVNNVDLVAAKEHGVVVTNVKGYSSHSVAQHTFGLILALTNHLEKHSDSVRAGGWVTSKDWCYTVSPLVELAGKTLGLIGLGDIGSTVAHIAIAFGMKVVVYRQDTTKPAPTGVSYVSLDELFEQSDVVSLHCPLTDDTKEIINASNLNKMKSSAYLINTGRGPLIHEKDLAAALNSGKIAGAGIDVLSSEPPKADNPLLSAKNCIITPHIAWASYEARKRLLVEVVANIRSFAAGEKRNVVNE